MVDVSSRPKPQEIYRHFKGNLYQIITLAEDTETGETLVIYQALYGSYRIWSRRLDNFLEKLDSERYPGAQQTFRFERVDNAERAENAGKAEKTAQPAAEPKGPEAEAAGRTAEHGSKTAEESGAKAAAESAAGEELQLDPLVEQFLDAGSVGERLSILTALRPRVTNDMIDICAMAAGVDIEPGDPLDRWTDLRECLMTIERYEQSRRRYNG